MDDSPCFSHLVMERSIPTNKQQRSRFIAAPVKDTTRQRMYPPRRNVGKPQIWRRDTAITCHSCRHTGVPRLSTDSLIKGGPRRESVWLALEKTALVSDRGTPHETSWSPKGSRVYKCQTKGGRVGQWMTC
jgi:hypothetical protein